jgi:MerR family transcriptional regulator, mercuric resistance operon regulatory protein
VNLKKGLTLELTPDCILDMRARKAVNQAVKIGVAAKETGLSVDAIRFYEKKGLLKRSPRTEGGFRLFGQREIEDLKFIGRAQELGFSLQEVRELLLLQGGEIDSCEHVRELLEQKVASVRGKIGELRKLRSSLGHALRQCKRVLEDTGPTHKGEGCPVLRDLGTTKKPSRRV